MAKFATFKYGSGILYGTATSIDEVNPDRGPSPGGNRFIMKGVGFDPRQWDDLFDGVSLDTVLWTDLSSGSGSVSTGAFHLQLDTGATPGSVAGIESKTIWGNVQGEIRINLPRIAQYPSDVVQLVALSLYVSATEYAIAYIELTPSVLQLRCEVYRNGALADELIVPLPWTTGVTMLKILRFGSDVYFYANGSLAYRSVRFSSTTAKFRIFSTNGSTSYSLAGIRVEWFYFRPFVVFQNQPVHDTVIVSDTRCRGIVPASRDVKHTEGAYQGLVDVSMIANGDYTKSNAYEYYFVEQFRVINSAQAQSKLSFINDPQLFTPEGEQKGLGGGE